MFKTAFGLSALVASASASGQQARLVDYGVNRPGQPTGGCGNLHFDVSVFPRDCWEVDGVCNLQCAPGFYPTAGTPSLTCLGSGEWSGRPLNCVPEGGVQGGIQGGVQYPTAPTTTCPDLFFDESLMSDCLGISQVCDMQCAPGYGRVEGEHQLRCLPSGEWNGQPLVCQRTTDSPQFLRTRTQPLKGAMASQIQQQWKKPIASQMQQQLQAPIASQIQQQQGIIDCPPLYFPTGVAPNACAEVGQKICDLSCVPGFTPVAGSARLTCLVTGEWSGMPLTCAFPNADAYTQVPAQRTQQQQQGQINIPMQQGQINIPMQKGGVQNCPPLYFPTGVATRSCEGSVCDMSCSPGFIEVSGSRRLTCNAASGEWLGGAPITCAFPDSVQQPLKEQRQGQFLRDKFGN